MANELSKDHNLIVVSVSLLDAKKRVGGGNEGGCSCASPPNWGGTLIGCHRSCETSDPCASSTTSGSVLVLLQI